jgi:hypothetical protein
VRAMMDAETDLGGPVHPQGVSYGGAHGTKSPRID